MAAIQAEDMAPFYAAVAKDLGWEVRIALQLNFCIHRFIASTRMIFDVHIEEAGRIRLACQDVGLHRITNLLQVDNALMTTLKEKNDAKIKELDEKIEDAVKNLGETEIKDALMAKVGSTE